MRTVASSCFTCAWSWQDFDDGWRERFANSAAEDSFAWGLNEQIHIAIVSLVETNLMRQDAKENLGMVRAYLLRLTTHFIQVLRMYMLGYEPDLLDEM